MEQELNKLFAPLKRVRPRADFAAQARIRLMAHGAEAPRPSFRRGFFEDLAFGGALVLASIILILGAALYSSFGARAIARRGVDTVSVLRESQALDFSIELGEAVYFSESADAVAAVIKEIANP